MPIIYVIAIVVLYLVIVNIIRHFRNKSIVMSPLNKRIVEKYLDDIWDIDIHTHLLRPIRCGTDPLTIRDLLGVIKIDTMKGREFNITVPSSKNCVLDFYNYNAVENKVGELVRSIPNVNYVSTGPKGNINLPNGYYLPLLRVKGSLDLKWLNSINVGLKAKTAPLLYNYTWKEPIQYLDRYVYDNHPYYESKETSREIGISPFTTNVRKFVLNKNVQGPKKLTLIYTSKEGNNIITSNVIGNHIDEITGDNNIINTHTWEVNERNKDIAIIETVYNCDLKTKLNNFILIEEEL